MIRENADFQFVDSLKGHNKLQQRNTEKENSLPRVSCFSLSMIRTYRVHMSSSKSANGAKVSRDTAHAVSRLDAIWACTARSLRSVHSNGFRTFLIDLNCQSTIEWDINNVGMTIINHPPVITKDSWSVHRSQRWVEKSFPHHKLQVLWPLMLMSCHRMVKTKTTWGSHISPNCLAAALALAIRLFKKTCFKLHSIEV